MELKSAISSSFLPLENCLKHSRYQKHQTVPLLLKENNPSDSRYLSGYHCTLGGSLEVVLSENVNMGAGRVRGVALKHPELSKTAAYLARRDSGIIGEVSWLLTNFEYRNFPLPSAILKSQHFINPRLMFLPA